MPDRRRPVVAAAVAGVVVLVALLAVGVIGSLLHIRSQVSAASDELTRVAQAAGDLPARVTAGEVREFVAKVPAPVKLIGRFGQDVAVTGPPVGLWDRGDAGWTGRLAVAGSSATVLDGAVETRRALANGRSIALRRDLGAGATSIQTSAQLLGGAVALALAVLAGLGVLLRERWRADRVDRLAAAAEAVAAGRPPPDESIPHGGEVARLGAALRSAGDRLTRLGEVADRELGVLSAAIEPLPIGMAGRGPSGGRLRNLALERMLDGLPPEDRSAIDLAVQDGLEATGPVGSRVPLGDGRLMEVDGWPVPGGRLVSVAERTEQDRLATLRRQLEGSAVRQLRAPIDEIRSRGSELYTQVPASAAPALRAILAATDRLDRVVRMLLRGTAYDPALRPPRRETFGVAGLLWGLAHDWDAALRQRALRVDLDVGPDLPEVRTDPALVEEILTELVDNAAKYTPRGGTISMVARPGDGAVVIEVCDTGEGFAPQDTPHATERFFRGRHAESIPGAGLGLGVASALTERLGGALVVEAGPGGRVRLELPASAEAPLPELAGT